LVESLEFEGQPRVIDAKKSQDRGVQVAHMYRILGDVVGKIIRFPVAGAWLHASAGHPQRKAARVMIAAGSIGRAFTVREQVLRVLRVGLV